MNPPDAPGPPPPTPPAPPQYYPGGPHYQAQKDAEHIKLLSIFHYVYAGLMAVGTLWPLIYVAMGLMFLSMPTTVSAPTSPVAVSPSSPAPSAAPAPPVVSPGTPAPTVAPPTTVSYSSSAGVAEAEFMGWMFFAMGVLLAVVFLVLAVLNFFVGRFLSARRHRIFILVMSGLNAMAFPFGTALGVFTFIVILRPSVESIFEGRAEALGTQS